MSASRPAAARRHGAGRGGADVGALFFSGLRCGRAGPAVQAGGVSSVAGCGWSWGLLRDTSHVLLDGTADERTHSAIRHAIESDADNRIADLHLWTVGPGHYSALVSVVTHHPRPPAHFKALLAGIPRLAHVHIEVNECAGEPCAAGGR
jgi:hypothetical protein